MNIFEIQKDSLLGLSDVLLEELVARLAEAEVAAHGGNLAEVRWAGAITAPDSGIDIHVALSRTDFAGKFVARPNTIFQVKKHAMPAGAILSEMRPKGTIAASISHQASVKGSYVIVSLADDCSKPYYDARLAAMKKALEDDPNQSQIHLDFFDRSKLQQWLRQHPSVELWARAVLGQELSGWKPFGRWSNTPAGVDDTLITLPGVSVVLPGERHRKLSLAEAIDPTRQLILASNKCIRITGLSGVGKTRFVQALFDESVGSQPLDRTLAIYVDVGADPNPSARAMLDRLKTENRTAVLVLDNCPSSLHSDMTSLVAASKYPIKLITVEYDIRDDKPQTTEVVHIEANGPEIAEALLERRFPKLGQVNARRIAELSDGNARVALALAERVEVGESLALLSDANLFDRLFQQRNEPDSQLRQHAEVLSLVYSFSVESVENETDEIAILASLCDTSRASLFRSTALLLSRHVAQKRGKWRAVLPHAVANRLAEHALNGIPIAQLRSTFEKAENTRLFRSFAHRLGLMHDHDIANQLVETWLADDGLLADILNLNDDGAQILEYLAPVSPVTVLNRIEAIVKSPDFAGLTLGYGSRRTTVLNLLVQLAYEASEFDRCVQLLLIIAAFENPSNNQDAVREKLGRFFQPYLSGTHATIKQRSAIVRECLWSSDPAMRNLGLMMLSKTLDGPPWSGSGTNDFGARPRDFGLEPNWQQLVSWRQVFIDIATEAGGDRNQELSDGARTVLAQEFRGLWKHAPIRSHLVEAGRRLQRQRPWPDGWKAVRTTIFFDYRPRGADSPRVPLPQELMELRELLAPTDLYSRIATYVLGQGHDHWSLDEEFDDTAEHKYEASTSRLRQIAFDLGQEFAHIGHSLSELMPGLLASGYMPYRDSFGQGLASGANDVVSLWKDLVVLLHSMVQGNFDFSVLAGFLHQVSQDDPQLCEQILDSCVTDTVLRTILVRLHPRESFGEPDFDRCMQVLDFPDVSAAHYGDLLWSDRSSKIPPAKLIKLGEQLLSKECGDNILLNALSMKLHDKDIKTDVLGVDFRNLGLRACTTRLLRSQDDPGGSTDYHMAQVLGCALAYPENEDQKSAWLNAIFEILDQRHGYLSSFDDAIRTTVSVMLEPFLDRVFSSDETLRRRRQHLLEHGVMNRFLLTNVSMDRLIAWCRLQSVNETWDGVAHGISPFEGDVGEGSSVFSKAAIEFLEVSPDPKKVLGAFAGKIGPTSWSGSKVMIMERNLGSFRSLLAHQDDRIARAAKLVVAQAENWIEIERERETREDERREQRFE